MSIMQAIGLLYVSEMVLSFLYTVVWKAMLRPGKNLSKRMRAHSPGSDILPWCSLSCFE